VKCFPKKEKLVDFTLKKIKNKIPKFPNFFVENGEIFPGKIFAQHLLYVLVKYQVIY
jgi:hypothetical protein